MLSRLKVKALVAYHSRHYDRLDPAGYSSQDFRAVADESASLLRAARRNLPRLPPEGVQEVWRANLEKVGKQLESPLGERFFSTPGVQEMTVRRGWREDQRRELAYLQSVPQLYERIRRTFRDSRVGGPYLECRELGCSTSAIGYLYYLARLQAFQRELSLPQSLDGIVELGGGFGGFCRVVHWAAAPRTYTIVDLPEFSSLQYVYLKTSMPDRPVQFVTDPQEPLIEDGIRLVPVNLVLAAPPAFRARIFTSHFALTEAGKAVRNRVYDLEFFGAEQVFYIGQQAARWKVSVDPEVQAAMPEAAGWRSVVRPFHMKDCVEIFGDRAGGARKVAPAAGPAAAP